MQGTFAELAESSEDVCLDLSRVRFLSSAGVEEIVSLGKALGERSLKLRIVRANGQPQHLMRQTGLWRLFSQRIR